MSRIYSGNLIDLRDATMRLYQMDFSTVVREDYDAQQMVNIVSLKVTDRAGYVYANQSFQHHDQDVLTITATTFLNELADQLSTWSKPQ